MGRRLIIRNARSKYSSFIALIKGVEPNIFGEMTSKSGPRRSIKARATSCLP